MVFPDSPEPAIGGLRRFPHSAVGHDVLVETRGWTMPALSPRTSWRVTARDVAGRPGRPGAGERPGRVGGLRARAGARRSQWPTRSRPGVVPLAASPRTRPESWMRYGTGWTVELPAGIRTLYPQWAVSAGPALPAGLGQRDLLHAPTAVAVPPAGPSQRLVVTVHDLAFLIHPERSRAVEVGLPGGARAAVRSADALIAVSRHTAEDLVAPHARAAGQGLRHAARPALPHSDADVFEVLDAAPRSRRPTSCRGHARAAEEPDPAGPCVPAAGGARGSAHPRPGRARGLAPRRAAGRDLEGRAPANDRAHRVRSSPSASWTRCTGRADAFVYPSLYEGFGLPVAGGHGARRARCVVSTSSSLPEVAGEAAVLVDPRSTASIAEAIDAGDPRRPLAARLRMPAGRGRPASVGSRRPTGRWRSTRRSC